MDAKGRMVDEEGNVRVYACCVCVCVCACEFVFVCACVCVRAFVPSHLFQRAFMVAEDCIYHCAHAC